MSALNKYIKKKIVNAGKGLSDFTDGTKVTFHVKVETLSDEMELDDSRNWSEPVELLLGKKFKLEVWEACVRTMCLGEVSQFDVDKKLVTSYPMVAKALRDYNAKKAGKQVEARSHHCCGFGMKEGLGYPDLDELIVNPQDLRFTMELVKVDCAGTYEKEFWAMTEDEQRVSVQHLREQGNNLYKAGNYELAAKKYFEAIGRLDNLMLKDKPGEEEWNALNSQKLPLLLNYSQCQLLLGEYYSAIEHCSDVLKYEPDNVKALFRRGRAYIKVFSPKEAQDDLQRVAHLDSSLSLECKKLLMQLSAMEKEKLKKDKQTYKKLFT